MNKSNKPVEIFTDGSVTQSTSKGGYGIVLLFGGKQKRIKSSSYLETTSARMEIKAVIKALEVLKPGFDIYVYSDYKMMVDIINIRLTVWMELGIFHEKSNYKLWIRFLKARRKHIEGGSNMLFCWIRSHSGIKYNEIADKLASEARKNEKSIICKDFN